MAILQITRVETYSDHTDDTRSDKKSLQTRSHVMITSSHSGPLQRKHAQTIQMLYTRPVETCYRRRGYVKLTSVIDTVIQPVHNV